jgi:hypothetical protein
MWRLRVLSPGAAHINFGFGRFELPNSADFTIYSLDGSDVLRPMTSADNPASSEYWTRIVWGDEVVIEITVDQHDREFLQNNIELTAINEGYRGFEAPPYRGSSESCNVDVICPLGDGWRSEIPSVGMYTINGNLTCTGAMVNNTNEDQTPYFLTANHCGIGNNNDQSVVVYWNHENSYCRTPGSGDSGGNGNGSFSQYTSGCNLLARDNYSDTTLVVMNSAPDPAWNVSFAGWSRADSAANGAAIHHPECAEKHRVRAAHLSLMPTIARSGICAAELRTAGMTKMTTTAAGSLKPGQSSRLILTLWSKTPPASTHSYRTGVPHLKAHAALVASVRI